MPQPTQRGEWPRPWNAAMLAKVGELGRRAPAAVIAAVRVNADGDPQCSRRVLGPSEAEPP